MRTNATCTHPRDYDDMLHLHNTESIKNQMAGEPYARTRIGRLGMAIATV